MAYVGVVLVFWLEQFGEFYECPFATGLLLLDELPDYRVFPDYLVGYSLCDSVILNTFRKGSTRTVGTYT